MNRAMSELVDWPAPERNKGPILDVLRRVLPERGTVLEVASATGQHIAHFASAFPNLTFQPSDVTDEHLGNLAARRAHVRLPNLREAIRLDASEFPWPAGPVDAVYNANMIHISPFSATMGLFRGASELLKEGAPLITYGPYSEGGQHISESNRLFDESLRSRNPKWGVRDLNDLVPIAQDHGFTLEERVLMPANNLTLIWRKVG